MMEAMTIRPQCSTNLARTEPHLKVVHHPCNSGYGAALRTGIAHATREVIFYMHGDGQYDVSELAVLAPLVTEGIDVVNGYKRKRSDHIHRRAIGALYNQMARLLFRLPVRDVDCDFRLIRHASIERISLESSSGVICVEVVRKLHAAVASSLKRGEPPSTPARSIAVFHIAVRVRVDPRLLPLVD